MGRFKILEQTDFLPGSTTERGEKVYNSCKITLYPPGQNPITRVIQTAKGVGITDEWIEDTMTGVLLALEKDFPDYKFKVVRDEPNVLRVEFEGYAGLTN